MRPKFDLATGGVEHRENRNCIVNPGGLCRQFCVLAGWAIPGFCPCFSGFYGGSIHPVDGRRRYIGTVAGIPDAGEFSASPGDARHASDTKLEGEKAAEKQPFNLSRSA